MGRIFLGSFLRHSSRGCRTVSAASLSSSSSSQALLSAGRLSSSASNFRSSFLSFLGYVHLSSRTSSCVSPPYLPRLLLSTKTSSSDDTEDLDDAPLPGESFVSSFVVVSFCQLLLERLLFACVRFSSGEEEKLELKNHEFSTLCGCIDRTSWTSDFSLQ